MPDFPDKECPNCGVVSNSGKWIRSYKYTVVEGGICPTCVQNDAVGKVPFTAIGKMSIVADSGLDLRQDDALQDRIEKSPWKVVWIQIWDDASGKLFWYAHGANERSILRHLKIKTDWPELDTVGEYLKRQAESKPKSIWSKFKKLFTK